MRKTSVNVNDAVYCTDKRGCGEHRRGHRHSRIIKPKNEAADHRRKREIGADREIDAARQDDQLLANGDDRNDRRLRENVADIDRLQKIGGQLTDRRNQNDQDQERTDAQKPECQRNR